MSALDLTSFDAALKQHYTRDRVKEMSYDDCPLLAMLPKMTKFGGKNLPVAVQFGNPQGVSNKFVNAQANKRPSSYDDFVLTRAKGYGLASIDNETLLAAKSDADAFLDAATSEIDGVINSTKNALSRALFGNGSGSIGLAAAGTTTTSIVLADVNDVVNFELNMTLQSAATELGAVDPGVGVITAIDRGTGVITISPAIPALASGRFIFQDGDAPDGSGQLYAVTGLQGWIPATAPSATPFFGVVRTRDTDRLGGVRYDGTLETIEEALIGCAHRLAREGARPDVVFMNPIKVGQLVKALGSKVEYDVVCSADVADIGFEAIKIRTPIGTLKVVSDRYCPLEEAWMLQMNTWKLYSLGDAPRILDTDGLRFLREAAADSVEVRVGYYAQLGCSAPGWNAHIAF